MSPAELAERVRAQLAAAADPAHRDGVRWFFKEAVDPYGVRSPQVHKIAAEAHKVLRHWPVARRNSFCRELWKSGKMEEGAVAIYVYRRFGKQCAACEFQLFEKWIDRYVRNWAHCDGVASWLVAAAIGNEPELIPLLSAWTRSSNRWKRRAAAVSLLQEAKQGRHTREILQIADALLNDPDDMVLKGAGWLLKETYPKKPCEVVRFLSARRGTALRLAVRIAAEKMPPQVRAGVLR
jgi:3-methyladenine DNA glycosylase AlkD